MSTEVRELQNEIVRLKDRISVLQADKVDLQQKLMSATKERAKLEVLLAEKEKEIRTIKPFFSIRRKVEIYESLLAPELKDAAIKSTQQHMDYHEAKWSIIVTKTSDPRVVRLNGLIAAANIPPAVFCRTMSSFFIIALGGIHLPSLSSYSKTEMECILRDEFEIHDDTTIRCVTEVLMEM